jgi:hypothetical protein
MTFDLINYISLIAKEINHETGIGHSKILRRIAKNLGFENNSALKTVFQVSFEDLYLSSALKYMSGFTNGVTIWDEFRINEDFFWRIATKEQCKGHNKYLAEFKFLTTSYYPIEAAFEKEKYKINSSCFLFPQFQFVHLLTYGQEIKFHSNSGKTFVSNRVFYSFNLCFLDEDMSRTDSRYKIILQLLDYLTNYEPALVIILKRMDVQLRKDSETERDIFQRLCKLPEACFVSGETMLKEPHVGWSKQSILTQGAVGDL